MNLAVSQAPTSFYFCWKKEKKRKGEKGYGEEEKKVRGENLPGYHKVHSLDTLPSPFLVALPG